MVQALAKSNNTIWEKKAIVSYYYMKKIIKKGRLADTDVLPHSILLILAKKFNITTGNRK